ncbi:hypothetical protein [Desulfogranum japonicum]|nr:hypothetical protein [Desulfogranum japonicum]
MPIPSASPDACLEWIVLSSFHKPASVIRIFPYYQDDINCAPVREQAVHG